MNTTFVLPARVATAPTIAGDSQTWLGLHPGSAVGLFPENEMLYAVVGAALTVTLAVEVTEPFVLLAVNVNVVDEETFIFVVPEDVGLTAVPLMEHVVAFVVLQFRVTSPAAESVAGVQVKELITGA